MGAFAYVLVGVEPGRERDVLALLGNTPGVSEVYAVHGDVPIVARVEADGLDAVGAVVIHGIRATPGVTTTITLPGARFL